MKGGYQNKYLFANKQLDNETDLQYFEKRYYDPRIGRFTTEDPVFWEVGLTERPDQYFTDPQQWNSYSYVRNNPINLVDPTGELVLVIAMTPEAMVAAAAIVGWTITQGDKIGNFLQASYNAITSSISTSTSSSQAQSASSSSASNQSKEGQAATGQGQTISQSSAGSPSPSGGGGKKDDKRENRGSNRSTTTNKTYDEIAKEKGMIKVPNTYSNGRPVYKGQDGKYYSPEKTSHNTTDGWKIGKVKNNKFDRYGTVDSNLSIIRK